MFKYVLTGLGSLLVENLISSLTLCASILLCTKLLIGCAPAQETHICLIPITDLHRPTSRRSLPKSFREREALREPGDRGQNYTAILTVHTSRRWNLLHQVILGIGSMCVLGDMGDGSDTLRLYDRATSAVNAALFGTSSLTSVQAFVLLGNYAQKLNHPSAGSVFLGKSLASPRQRGEAFS